jgi:hypothetical protein
MGCLFVKFTSASLERRNEGFWKKKETRKKHVSHGGLASYIKKYLKAKEELWKLKYFTGQNYNLQKIL